MFQYHRAAMQIRKTYPFDVLVYNNALVGFFSMLMFQGTIGMINDYTNATWAKDQFGNSGENKWKRRLFSIVEKWFCRWSKNKIITNSRYLSSVLALEYQVPESRFLVLHKGIEESLIKQNRSQLAEGKTDNSILFVKTNYMLAGFKDLAEAVKKLDRKVRLTVVGPAKEQHAAIRELVAGSEADLDLARIHI